MKKNKAAKKPAINVEYIAQLARLELDPATVDKLQKNMENIVGYVDLLGELELDNVEPTAHPIAANNVWREEDKAGESLPQEVMLSNVQDVVNEELIRVPQVIPCEEN